MKRDCNPSGPRKGRPFPSRLRPAVVALLALGGSASAGLAVAQTSDADSAEKAFTLGGYVRTWASMNLQDQPETKGDDKHKLSMLRGSILLDADYKPSSTLRFKAIARVDREARTSYLKSLEADSPNPKGAKPVGSTAWTFDTAAGGNVGGLQNFYDNGEFREWWVESDVTDRVKFKFGRQQIVWGETDFFRSLDVVHGFDYSWRSFLEVENEELRKPLVILRSQIQVPEAKGSLDVFVRPGWDRDGDIGNTYDLAGGRWASQPTRGASFLYATSYNYHSKGADQDDVTGGIRWQGIAGPVNYSVAWINTFNNDPVANPCPANLALLGTTGAVSFKQAPVACGFVQTPYTGGVAGQPQFGDWIFPKTNIFGATASGYVPAVDAVFTMELGYQRDRSFNYGFVNQGPVGTNLPGRTNFVAPGALGVIQKNTLTTMIRMDKQLDLSNLIGTSRPSFSSIQLFNTRILNFNAAEEIVQLAYWGRARSKDSALLTGFIVMNYDNDRINPGLAAGWDVSYGGGFIIPSIEFVLGDKWRVKAEADLFYASGNEKQSYLSPTTFLYEEQGKGAGLMGYFSKSNQAMIRVTRQF